MDRWTVDWPLWGWLHSWTWPDSKPQTWTGQLANVWSLHRPQCGYVADRLKIYENMVSSNIPWFTSFPLKKGHILWHKKMAFPMAFSGGKPDHPPCR